MPLLRRARPLLAVVALALPTVLAAQDEGLTIVARTTSSSTGPSPAPQGSGTRRIMILGDRVRTEFDDATARAPLPPRATMIMAGGPTRMMVLDTAQHTYFVMDVN